MRKNIQEVYRAWRNGRSKGGESCSSNGHEIYSYATCLVAVYRGGSEVPVVILNTTSYSVTTSGQQSALRFLLDQDRLNVVKVDGLDLGATVYDLRMAAGKRMGAAMDKFAAAYS